MMENKFYMKRTMKFNSLQFNSTNCTKELSRYSLEVLQKNEKLEEVYKSYKDIFSKDKVKNISFSEDGFCALFLSLNGKIAVSVGESEFIVQGAQKAKTLGADISFVLLQKDGTLDTDSLDEGFDFIFISSYVIDTYVKVDLQKVKKNTKAKIVSNATVHKSEYSDIYLLDGYKLCGIGASGIFIYDEGFSKDALSQIDLLSLETSLNAYKEKKVLSRVKQRFLKEFQRAFLDDLYLFVDPESCLEFTLHLGLRDIKMRDIIRTLAFEDILITNGEGCSLGLSRPSRILQEMGYSEDESRWGLSLDFSEELSDEQIEQVVETIYKKYRQIKVLG